MEVQCFTYDLDSHPVSFWTSGSKTWCPDSINFENRKVVLLHTYANGLNDPVFQILNNSDVKNSFYGNDGTYVLFFIFDLNVNHLTIVRIVKWFIETDLFNFKSRNQRILNQKIDRIGKIPFDLELVKDLDFNQMIKLNTMTKKIHNVTPQEYVGIYDDSDSLEEYLDCGY